MILIRSRRTPPQVAFPNNFTPVGFSNGIFLVWQPYECSNLQRFYTIIIEFNSIVNKKEVESDKILSRIQFKGFDYEIYRTFFVGAESK